jgi:hypothetical protein
VVFEKANVLHVELDSSCGADALAIADHSSRMGVFSYPEEIEEGNEGEVAFGLFAV